MTTVVIVIHLMVVLAMIGLVLLQRSEGGALGIGGGQGAFLSGRSAGNVLTRTTAILAVAFFVTSLGLAILAKYQSRPSDILQTLPGQTAPAETPATPLPAGAGGQAPATAQDLIRQLGGTAGPQQPPADPPAAPASESVPSAPVETAPAETAPAAAPEAPDASETAPASPSPAPAQ